MMKAILIFAVTLGFVGSAFALEGVRVSEMTKRPFACSNGGAVRLIPTPYENVQKIVFSSPGSVDQYGYTHFNSMSLAEYSGTIATSKIREGYIGPTYADITVVPKGKGLVLTVTPVRMSAGPGFVCRNY